MMMNKSRWLPVLVATGLVSGGALAAEVSLSASSIAIDGIAGGAVSSLRVTGPDNYQFEREIGNKFGGSSASSVFGLGELNVYADGLYNYELVEYRYGPGQRIVYDAPNGREQGALQRDVSTVVQTGIFRVKNGSILVFDDTVKE